MQQTHKTNESLAPQPLSRTGGTTSCVGLALSMGLVTVTKKNSLLTGKKEEHRHKVLAHSQMNFDCTSLHLSLAIYIYKCAVEMYGNVCI